MQKNQKGFTIIELIVVIAIIAVLATIVMINVTQYINKSKDAAIKANVDTIMTNAAVYFADVDAGNGDFNGFLAKTDYTVPSGQITTQNGTITVECDDTDNDCTSSASHFCISVELNDDSEYCKDDAGRVTTGTCAAGVCGS